MKYMFLILSFLFLTFAEAVPISNPQVVLKGENQVNFTATGLTLIASNLPSDFVPTEFLFYGINVVGATPPVYPKFSIGWTSPDYQDVLSPFTQPVRVTGCFANYGFGNTSPSSHGTAPILPGSTDIYINVTTADTVALSNTQQVYIIGYYLY